MATIRNNYVFKGHKTLLGSRFVTYGEVELPTRYDKFPQSSSGFDWGYAGSAAIQLAFSMLYQVSNVEFAKKHATKYANDVIKTLPSRDWVMNASEVLDWIERNKEENEEISNPLKSSNTATTQTTFNIQTTQSTPQVSMKLSTTKQKEKSNVVKDVCKELGITQKNLAEILEVPEGTVSSWAVKNEIPRLGKKAIEFYIQSQKNQSIVDSYKNFVQLLNVS
jgi:DNA-binding transcriptional regulator YiaG